MTVLPFRKNSVRLRFKTDNDAIRYAEKGVRDSESWLATHNISRCHDYINGHLNIALKLRLRSHAGDFNLLFRAVPPDARDLPNAGHLNVVVNTIHSGLNLEQGLVLVGAGNLTKRPENVIASTVRLCRREKRPEFDGDFLEPLGDEDFREAARVAVEGEITVRGWPTQGDNGVVSCLVKRVPEIVDSIGEDGANGQGQHSLDPKLEDVLTGLRVYLSDEGPGVTFDHNSIAARFEIIEVFFCPSDEQFGAGEGKVCVVHVKET